MTLPSPEFVAAAQLFERLQAKLAQTGSATSEAERASTALADEMDRLASDICRLSAGSFSDCAIKAGMLLAYVDDTEPDLATDLCLSLCLDVIQLAIAIESAVMFHPRVSAFVSGR